MRARDRPLAYKSEPVQVLKGGHTAGESETHKATTHRAHTMDAPPRRTDSGSPPGVRSCVIGPASRLPARFVRGHYRYAADPRS